MAEKGVSKAGLEKACELSNGVILKWEKGLQNPATDAIVKIADYFDVSTDYLLGRTEIKTPLPKR